MVISKRVVASIILILFLLNSLMPIITYAEDNSGTQNSSETTQEEVGREYEIKEEETWDVSENGDGSVIAKWTLKDRTLTISGSGKMKDWNGYSAGSNALKEDWHQTKYTKAIENVIIKNGITSIGDSAFDRCGSLTNIEIPSSITDIRGEAFYDCYSLINIEIPSNVTIIKYNAFVRCSNLREINVDSRNQNYTSIDGVLFNKDKTEIVKYPSGKEVTKYNIPNSVTSIGVDAFYGCSSLTNIEIPSSVTSIGADAFENCSSLTNIEIPNSVTSIGRYAFYGCSSLTNIEIPSNVTSIGDSVFYGCSSLTKIEIPSSVISIGSAAFRECSSLKNIDISNSVTKIGSEAFNGCSSLTKVVIPNGLSCIDRLVFRNCSSLAKIEIPSNVTSIADNAFDDDFNGIIMCYTNSEAHKYAENKKIWYKLVDNIESIYETKYIIREQGTWDLSKDGDESVIARWTLNDRTLRITGNGKMQDMVVNEVPWHNIKINRLIEKVVIEDGVTSIGESAFYDCSSLINIEIPNSVTSIGDRAFEDCRSLTNIEIPSSVKSIEESIFEYCSSLTNIEIPNSVTSIGSDAFKDCSSLTNIEIPSSVTYIGRYAFESCSSLTRIEIPSSVTSIKEDTFYKCRRLKDIKVDSENQKYASIDGILFNKDKTELITFPSGKEATKYIIPNSVKSIGENTFSGCSSLSNIEIPNSVTRIGHYAFSGCSSLANIEIPNSVISIGWEAFSGCRSLTNIKIPNSIKNIGAYTFSGYNGIISCIKNSEAHRYAENNKIGYILYEEEIEVNFETNGGNQPQKEVSIGVNVNSTDLELDEDSFKYIWSTKEVLEKEEITNSFTNGEKIMSPKGATGLYYLYVYAADKNGKEIIEKSSGIMLDNTIPTINVTYSSTNLTKQNVIVTITANEKVQGVSGWTLSNDGLKLTKTYTANTKENGEEIVIKDLAGNATKKIIKVTNIDKTAPTITGVTNNQKYFRKATPKITDENINTIELTKDGEKVTNYTNGQEITGAGNYKLTATDKVGNSTIVNFSIYDIQTESYQEKTVGNENYLGKINVGEKASKIETLLKNVSSYKITRNGTEIFSSTNQNNDQDLYTGDKIEFESQAYMIIVTGDINKDGKANIIDLAKCMKVVLGKKTLNIIEGLAADTNFDEKVNIVDLARIRKLSLNN